MAEALSSEVENLVRRHVDGHRFTSANDVILVAMRLFDELERRYGDELESAIKRGFAQIDGGEGIELNDEGALRGFFDDIKRRGRQRIEASKGE